jgi:endonuclease/exonuclease/phosphatase family metal-dependent hydrolase
MASSWRFELGRARATARIGYDYLRSLLWPPRGDTIPGDGPGAPTVVADSGTPVADSLPATLRLLSWNIHRAYDDRGVTDSLRAVIRDRDPHVVLLQEVPVCPHGPWWLEPGVQTVLAGMQLVFAAMHRVARPTAYYPFLESGVLIGVRSPLASHRAMRLPVASRPKLGRNHRIERVALGIRCRAGTLTPEIWNVHLENTARPSARARQAMALAAALGDGCAIVGGDFNTMFGKLEGVPAALEAAGLQRVVPGNERRMSPSIDHIFVRGVAAARAEVLRLRGSDHLPIYAEVELGA